MNFELFGAQAGLFLPGPTDFGHLEFDDARVIPRRGCVPRRLGRALCGKRECESLRVS